jgi:hypothetical protein
MIRLVMAARFTMAEAFPGVRETKPNQLVREDATGFEVAVSPAVTGSKVSCSGQPKSLVVCGFLPIITPLIPRRC